LRDLKALLYFIRDLPPEYHIFMVLAVLVWLVTKWDKNRHLLSRLEASQRLKQLRRTKTPENKITFLRGVNPFVFEEMILTALKRRGHKIIRNKKYTGDGGIDGQVTMNGVEYLIQAKRYKGHINPAHVREFALICYRRDKRALFVHTGRTGKQAAQIAHNAKMKMVSGDRLLNLLCPKKEKKK